MRHSIQALYSVQCVWLKNDSVQQDEGEQRTAEEQHALSDTINTITQITWTTWDALYKLYIQYSVSDCRMIQCSRMKENRAQQRNSTLWVTLSAPLHRFPSQHETFSTVGIKFGASQIDLEAQPFAVICWPPKLAEEKIKEENMSQSHECVR